MISNGNVKLGVIWAVLAGAVILSGCATNPMDKVDYSPTPPIVESLPPATPGSIYQAGRDIVLFEDAKARRVGDVLTIVLVERTNASKQASTSTSKESEVDLENPTLLGRSLSFSGPRGMDMNLGTNISGSRNFDGQGDSSQSNKLEGRITVTVADVLPNGNLFVRGEKWLTINSGDEYIRFSGIVRTVDIAPDNTVQSTLVADAKISYAGKGSLADANEQGWLGRFFSSKWWPF